MSNKYSLFVIILSYYYANLVLTQQWLPCPDTSVNGSSLLTRSQSSSTQMVCHWHVYLCVFVFCVRLCAHTWCVVCGVRASTNNVGVINVHGRL